VIDRSNTWKFNGATTLSIMTLSIITLSIITLSIRDLYVTLGIRDSQHNNALLLC
jgi:hypothetical protein